MNEQDDLTSRTPELDSQDSVPPTTPPSPDDSTGSKMSRKREREVSLEPATPQTTAIDIDADHPEHKERRTPAKKNRISVQLDTTQEEEEVPALSCSPPHETKIRQISQGVEDLTWPNMHTGKGADKDHEMGEPRVDEQREDAKIEAKVAGGEEVAVSPLLLQGENRPMVTDGAGEDEHGGEADPAEVPPDAQPSDPEDIATSDSHPEVSSTSAIPPVPTSAPQSRRGSDSGSDQEKGVKRKLGDRTVSERHVPGEESSGMNGIITGKRQRDDPDSDANPRVTKRPTPPPDEEGSGSKKAESSQAQKKSLPASATVSPNFGGFMAYANTSSPFASISGPSVFGSKASSPSSSAWASTSTSPNPSPGLTTSPSSNTTVSSPSKSPEVPLQQQVHKRTGFEAFASATSPFASAAKRPKSPPPLFSALSRSRSPSRHSGVRVANAFSAYAAGGAQSFSAHTTPKRGSPALGEGPNAGPSTEAPTRASVGLGIFDVRSQQGNGVDEEDGVNGGSSFGERLRAQKDQEDESDEDGRLELTERETLTGEEEEETVYQVRGKLFALSAQNQWKERGTGTLRLNVRRADGTAARLIMRKEAVYTVLLNATLFKGMRCFLAQDPRYLRFSVFEGSATTHFNLRVQSTKIAEELLDEINSHIPSE